MLLISPNQGSHVLSSTFLNYERKHEAFPSGDSGVLNIKRGFFLHVLTT